MVDRASIVSPKVNVRAPKVNVRSPKVNVKYFREFLKNLDSFEICFGGSRSQEFQKHLKNGHGSCHGLAPRIVPEHLKDPTLTWASRSRASPAASFVICIIEYGQRSSTRIVICDLAAPIGNYPDSTCGVHGTTYGFGFTGSSPPANL